MTRKVAWTMVSKNTLKRDTTVRNATAHPVSLCCVTSIIASRNIKPVSFASRLWLYGRDAVALIRPDLNTIDDRWSAEPEGGHLG